MNNVTPLLLTAYEKYGSVGMEEYIECFIDENLDTDEINLSDYSEYLANNYPDDCFYSMEEFDNIMSGYEPWEIARACFYGEFRPCDDYFKFNGHGNLESFDEWKIRKDAADDTNFLKWYISENNLVDEEEAQKIIDECNSLIRQGY